MKQKQTILFLRKETTVIGRAAAKTALDALTHKVGQPVVVYWKESSDSPTVNAMLAMGTEEAKGKYEIMATWDDLSGTYDVLDGKITAAVSALNTHENAVANGNSLGHIKNADNSDLTFKDGVGTIKEGKVTEAKLSPELKNSLVGKKTSKGGEIFNQYIDNSAGDMAHAEGYITTASGYASHAEGDQTTASGDRSHAEGSETDASGNYGSHAEGSRTTASGDMSHAEGKGTTAENEGQHTQGSFNVPDKKPSATIRIETKPSFVVGNGVTTGQEHDSLRLLNNGNLYLQGVGTFEGNETYDGFPASGKKSVQEVINNKSDKGHRHNASDIDGLPNITVKSDNPDVAGYVVTNIILNHHELTLKKTKFDTPEEVDIKISNAVNGALTTTMDYLGAITTGIVPTERPEDVGGGALQKGDVFVVSTKEITSIHAEIGDVIIYNGSSFDVVQKNLDGAVTGTGTSGYLPKFNGSHTIANGPLAPVVKTESQTERLYDVYEDDTDHKMKVLVPWKNTEYSYDANPETDRIFIDENNVIRHRLRKGKDTQRLPPISPGYSGSFFVIDTVESDQWGHITKVNKNEIKMPAVQPIPELSRADGSVAANGKFVTEVTVLDHEVTVSKGNTTDLAKTATTGNGNIIGDNGNTIYNVTKNYDTSDNKLYFTCQIDIIDGGTF